MNEVLQYIAQAGETEINKILTAVAERYGELFPDWELSAIPLQKSVDQNEQIDRFIAILQGMKNLP